MIRVFYIRYAYASSYGMVFDIADCITNKKARNATQWQRENYQNTTLFNIYPIECVPMATGSLHERDCKSLPVYVCSTYTWTCRTCVTEWMLAVSLTYIIVKRSNKHDIYPANLKVTVEIAVHPSVQLRLDHSCVAARRLKRREGNQFNTDRELRLNLFWISNYMPRSFSATPA
jgi:hypothetical protein